MTTNVNATDRPVWFATESGGQVIHAGMIETTGAIGTPLTLNYDTDEMAYLGKVADKAANYDPLPDSGWLEAGSIYGYAGGLVIVRQSHNRTIYPPGDTPALFCVYRPDAGLLEWIAGEPVYVGTLRSYDGVDYECLQQHVTQSDWTPPATASLWQVYTPEPPVGEWSYPVAYKIDDEVTYGGHLYRCLQAHTSQAGWTPPVVPALWLLV